MKYTCSACGRMWESAEEPFECPNCHSGNISSNAPSALVQSLAKYWWLIVLSIVAAVAIVLIPAGSDEPDATPVEETPAPKETPATTTGGTEEAEVAPVFSCSTDANLDRTPYTYTVTIQVKNLSSLTDVTYTLNGTTQRENVFRGVSDNQTCLVVVANGKTKTSQELKLRKIVPPKAITKEEVQSIFNQVANGTLSSGVARKKILGSGDIHLSDKTTTLTDVLSELEFAAKTSDKLHYTVVDFKTDKKTGRIVDGTLVIRK